MFTEKFSRTTTIHPGIFRGRALWADSVSPRKNTIASRDQFKPIRIGENLVVYYKVDYRASHLLLQDNRVTDCRASSWLMFKQKNSNVVFNAENGLSYTKIVLGPVT